MNIAYLVVHEQGNGRFYCQGCFSTFDKAKTYIKAEIANEAHDCIHPWTEDKIMRKWECMGEAYEIREFDVDWTPLTGSL